MKENVTLSNAYWLHKGDEASKKLYRKMCEYLNFELVSEGDSAIYYYLDINQAGIFGHNEIPNDKIEVSPSDYLSLLTPQQHKQSLTDKTQEK